MVKPKPPRTQANTEPETRVAEGKSRLHADTLHRMSETLTTHSAQFDKGREAREQGLECAGFPLTARVPEQNPEKRTGLIAKLGCRMRSNMDGCPGGQDPQEDTSI
ncbi:hypothetical protein NDU88_002893 [Pleurodeles waltl]|uniref:Uncharacterized protein n=1 Tax=Pleurodeles waltl TaxID=8319 RepID=A0AAV7TN69_PLEWA|nr:hypothetical protein NDU88_002893 [Pleurodeles waltl]